MPTTQENQIAPVAPVAPVAPIAETVAPVAPIAETVAPVAPVAETVAPVATVAPIAETVSTDTTKKSTKLSKTDKWKEIEAEVTAINSNPELKEYGNVQSLISKVIEHYKPKTGGDSMKDWSRRIEDALGNVIAKECSHTKLWFAVDEENIKASTMSKGKYTTKGLLKVLRDVKEDVTAEVVALITQGQAVTDQNKLICLNPETKEDELFVAVNALYPERVAQIAQDYNTQGFYLGANKEEANALLIAKGINTLIA